MDRTSEATIGGCDAREGTRLGRGLPLQSLGLVRRHGVLVLPRGSGLPGVAGAARRRVAQGVSSSHDGESAHRIALGSRRSRPAQRHRAKHRDRGRRLRWANHGRRDPSRVRDDGRAGLRPGCGTGGAKRTGRGGETSLGRVGCVGSADNGARPASGGFGGRTRGRATHRRRGAPYRRESCRHPPSADGARPTRGPLSPRRGRGRGRTPRLAAPPALGQHLEGAGEAACNGDAEDVPRRPVGTGPHARGLAAPPVRRPASQPG